jgi:hypothetical protein
MLDDIELDLGGDEAEEGSWTDSLGGISRTAFSALIFLASLVLLFWNEGYSKQHGDAVAEAGRKLTSVAATAAIDSSLDGQPVHLAATVSSAGGVRDPYFAIRSDGVGLYRSVYMYQWIEYKETRGKGARRRTSYSYEMDWDNVWHDSSKFNEPAGHENPPMPIESEGFFAEDARFGPYRFDNRDVFEQALAEFGEGEPGSLGRWPQYLEQLPPLRPELVGKRWYQIEADEYYRGNEQVEEYELGDLSVTFYAFPNNFPLSMVAAQQGDRLLKWPASNGDTVLLAAGGQLGADQIIAEAVALNSSRTRLLRIVGLIGCCLGFAGLTGALGGLLVSLPVVGRLIELSLMVAGMLIGLVFGLLTIVLGWLLARPWVGLLLLLALVVAMVWGSWRQRLIARAKREASRIARASALARQRAAERIGMPPVPGMGGLQPAMAGAAAGAPPPPPPGTQERRATPPLPPVAIGAAAARPSALSTPPAPAPAPAEGQADELPALEWTPNTLGVKPPAVMPRRDPSTPRPFDAVDDRDSADELPPLDWNGSPVATSVPAAVNPAPARNPVPPPTTAQQPAPLWETVEPRVMPDRSAAIAEANPASSGATAAQASASARRAAPEPTGEAPAAAPALRQRLGQKGPYTLNKLIRRQADGTEQLICFELMRDGKPIKRGTQAQVRETLQALLAKPG